MEEVLKQLNELCRDTLVDNLGMEIGRASCRERV